MKDNWIMPTWMAYLILLLVFASGFCSGFVLSLAP
jgi:hypothetical protein